MVRLAASISGRPSAISRRVKIAGEEIRSKVFRGGVGRLSAELLTWRCIDRGSPLTRRVIGHYFPGWELNNPTFRLPTRRCTGSRKKVTPGDTSRAVYRCGVTLAC